MSVKLQTEYSLEVPKIFADFFVAAHFSNMPDSTVILEHRSGSFSLVDYHSEDNPEIKSLNKLGSDQAKGFKLDLNQFKNFCDGIRSIRGELNALHGQDVLVDSTDLLVGHSGADGFISKVKYARIPLVPPPNTVPIVPNQD